LPGYATDTLQAAIDALQLSSGINGSNMIVSPSIVSEGEVRERLGHDERVLVDDIEGPAVHLFARSK
jgi:hypothetical protein